MWSSKKIRLYTELPISDVGFFSSKILGSSHHWIEIVPPPKKKVTVIGLVFHHKANGWMFFFGFKKLDTAGGPFKCTQTHNKFLQNIQQRNSSSFWFFHSWQLKTSVCKPIPKDFDHTFLPEPPLLTLLNKRILYTWENSRLTEHIHQKSWVMPYSRP